VSDIDDMYLIDPSFVNDIHLPRSIRMYTTL
jgi:hypothetical protein